MILVHQQLWYTFGCFQFWVVAKGYSVSWVTKLKGDQISEDFSLLVAFLLVTFSWLFRGPLLSRKTVFGPFSLLFRGFFVAPVLVKFYAYSPWNSLLKISECELSNGLSRSYREIKLLLSAGK